MKLTPKDIWEQEFKEGNLYKEIIDFVNIKFLTTFIENYKNTNVVTYYNMEEDISTYQQLTPREQLFLNKSVTLDSFRILEFFDKFAEKPIYDIGCGMNLFKNFYNVIGIDPNNVMADKKDIFDDDFVKNHQNCFPSAIAINSLHFITIDDAQHRINQFASTIKKQGYGYITFNARMFFLEDDFSIDHKQLKDFFDNIIKKIDLCIIDYDFLVTDAETSFSNPYDGNIRILFKNESR